MNDISVSEEGTDCESPSHCDKVDRIKGVKNRDYIVSLNIWQDVSVPAVRKSVVVHGKHET